MEGFHIELVESPHETHATDLYTSTLSDRMMNTEPAPEWPQVLTFVTSAASRVWTVPGGNGHPVVVPGECQCFWSDSCVLSVTYGQSTSEKVFQ
jgi:hypothetical protein